MEVPSNGGNWVVKKFPCMYVVVKIENPITIPILYNLWLILITIPQKSNREIKNRKNTQHKTDIVIKKNGKAQTECVKSRKMPFQNPVKAKYDERKQNNTVQPHQMEKICHIVSHQCVGNRKNQARRSDTALR